MKHYKECNTLNPKRENDICDCEEKGKKAQLLENLISNNKLNEAIELALTAPFPQIAIHHLIDKLFENGVKGITK